jgi:hypothetical protein
VGTLGNSLDKAAVKVFTRPIPKSARAQMRFLVQRHNGSTQAAARLLGVSLRTVERYLAGQFKRPPVRASPPASPARSANAGSPRSASGARKQAATTGGIVIETRARLGFTAAPGSTDDARLRLITQHLPPAHAARLFDAQAADATEQQLRDIAAEGLQEPQGGPSLSPAPATGGIG